MNDIFLNSWEPRTDENMLRSLLAQGEGPHLDFKADIDWNSKEAKVKFAKDVIAMINTHPGGHLVIGVSDDGKPISGDKVFDRKLYDSATLMDQVSAYINAPIDIRSQIHSIEGHQYVLIAVLGCGSWLPIPMGKQGNYKDSQGKQHQAFREGDIYLREGSKNVSIKYEHWETLLKRRELMIRKEAHFDIDSVIKALSDLHLTKNGVVTGIPLSLDLDYLALQKAVITYLDIKNTIPIEQLVRQAVNSDAFDIIRRLSIITIVAVQALIYNNRELIIFIIEKLYDLHESINVNDISNKLEVIVFLYIIGSTAVRYNKWSVIEPMVLKGETDYYRSWIRKTQVEASRNGLFKERSGMMIDMARAYISNTPEFRPDFINKLSTESIPLEEPITNSLCQFDFIQVIIQGIHHRKNSSNGYPSCVFYAQSRIEKFMITFVHSPEIRQELTHLKDEKLICKAFKNAWDISYKQSIVVGNCWDLPEDKKTVEYLNSCEE